MTRSVCTMRLPIILALIVIITLPKDVQGLADDVSAQVRVATASISKFLDRNEADEPTKVAELRLPKRPVTAE
jgi:hypothetical protein